MPLKEYQCPQCDALFASKSTHPTHCGDVAAIEVLTVPQIKLQEKDSYTGKSKLVDQEQILRSRARNHAREHDLDDLISMNDRKSANENKWLVEGGRRKRKAVDDL